MRGLWRWFRANWAFLALITGIVLVFAVFRTTPDVSTSEELDRTLTNGQPTVISFYSNF